MPNTNENTVVVPVIVNSRDIITTFNLGIFLVSAYE